MHMHTLYMLHILWFGNETYAEMHMHIIIYTVMYMLHILWFGNETYVEMYIHTLYMVGMRLLQA